MTCGQAQFAFDVAPLLHKGPKLGRLTPWGIIASWFTDSYSMPPTDVAYCGH